MDSRFICTRTTARFILARQSTTPRLLSTSCQHLVDVEAWLKASRLRLNPAKTQVMCLGSQQLRLARLDMAALPVLSSSVRVQERFVMWAW